MSGFWLLYEMSFVRIVAVPRIRVSNMLAASRLRKHELFEAGQLGRIQGPLR